MRSLQVSWEFLFPLMPFDFFWMGVRVRWGRGRGEWSFSGCNNILGLQIFMILSILDRQETWKARKMLPRELFWLTVVNINDEDIILFFCCCKICCATQDPPFVTSFSKWKRKYFNSRRHCYLKLRCLAFKQKSSAGDLNVIYYSAKQ